jgi:hypothetical protein
MKVTYEWRVLETDEEGKPCQMIPWSDPYRHEYPFDYSYDTPEEAYEGLEDGGAAESASEEGWVLYKFTTSIEQVEVCDPNKLTLEE